MINFLELPDFDDIRLLVSSSSNGLIKREDLIADPVNIFSDISQVPSNTVILGGSSIFLGKNLFLNPNSGVLNYSIQTSLDSSEITGVFENINIKPKSISINKISGVQPNTLVSTNNLFFNQNQFNFSSSGISLKRDNPIVSTGYLFLSNPSTVEEYSSSLNLVVFLTEDTFEIITNLRSLNTIFINKSSKRVLINNSEDCIIYPGEKCIIVDIDNKIRSNFVGDFILDSEPTINSEGLGDPYDDLSVFIKRIEKTGTENNPIITFISQNSNLRVRVTGSNNEDLIEGVNYITSYNPSLGSYQVSLIAGSNSTFLGDFTPDGQSLTSNNNNTSNGEYSVFIRSTLQGWRKIYSFNIDSKKSIYIDAPIIRLKPGENIINIYDYIVGDVQSILPGMRLTYSLQIPQFLNSLNLEDVLEGSFEMVEIQPNIKYRSMPRYIETNPEDETYDWEFEISDTGIITYNIINSKILKYVPSLSFSVIDSNFVTDSGFLPFRVETLIFNTMNLTLVNSRAHEIDLLKEINIFGDYLSVERVDPDDNVESFGSIDWDPISGILSVNPTEFSTEAIIIAFNITDIYGNSFERELEIRLVFDGFGSSPVWRLDLNGFFSEIKLKTLSSGNYINPSSIATSLSTNIISEGGGPFNNSFWRGVDDLYLTVIEDSGIDPPNSSNDREYSVNPTGEPSSYRFNFAEFVRISEVLISPSVNDGDFMTLPNNIKLYRSLDNGVTWLLEKSIDVLDPEVHIDKSWYPYVVTDPLEALYNTGGFFRIII